MESIFTVVIWTLAFYGMFEIIKNIIYIFSYTKMNTDGIYFIIAIKNQENIIETFFRTLMFKIIYGKEDIIKNIIVIDLNSTDKTKLIIEKLQKEYSQIKILNLKDCKELLENIKEVKYQKIKNFF